MNYSCVTFVIWESYAVERPVVGEMLVGRRRRKRKLPILVVKL